MIQKAILYTRNSLNQFIKNRFGLDEGNVIVNNIVDDNGAILQDNQNKLVLSLINVEQERMKPFYGRNRQMENGNFSRVSPTERLNLDLMLVSIFDDYQESLKFLSAGILFFQIHPYLSASSFADIPQGLDKLEFELEKINYHQMHSLWSAMGGKYRPSVIYHTRLISVQGDETAGFVPAVHQSDNSATP